MGIREVIDQRRKGILTALFILIAVVVAWTVHGKRGVGAPSSQHYKAWFSVDDGKSWFADDARKIPPFDVQGKTAVRCHVHRCSVHGVSFVSHLLRYTPAGRKLQERLWAQKSFDPSEMATLQDLIEIKPPNAPEAKWIKRGNPQAAELERPRCPQGCVDQITPVDAN